MAANWPADQLRRAALATMKERAPRLRAPGAAAAVAAAGPAEGAGVSGTSCMPDAPFWAGRGAACAIVLRKEGPRPREQHVGKKSPSTSDYGSISD